MWKGKPFVLIPFTTRLCYIACPKSHLLALSLKLAFQLLSLSPWYPMVPQRALLAKAPFNALYIRKYNISQYDKWSECQNFHDK